MKIVVILFICLILHFLREYRSHRKNVERIPLRILVNGTRGKTTVTRIITYALQESGMKTVGISSGSSLEIIHSDGKVEKVERRRRANIREMIPFFRLALEEKAEAVVVEDMALTEENQRVLRDNLVKPDIVVITNTYIDHVPEMGKTTEETAWCLSRSVPSSALLYTTEDHYQKYSSNVRKVEEEAPPSSSPIPLHPSTWAIAKRVLLDLGVKEETILSALNRLPEEIDLMKEIALPSSSVLIPTFSVNDRECMRLTILEEMEKHPGMKCEVVFNNRKDREHRVILLEEVLFSIEKARRPSVMVIGDYRGKVSFHLNRRGFDALPFSLEEAMERMKTQDNTLFIGLGNIKGEGEKLLSILEEEK